MRTSIQTKFLVVCIFLAFLITTGISVTYYVLTKQDKHRESRQRIQIAFDIFLDDLTNRLDTYLGRFDEFLKENVKLRGTTSLYSEDTNQVNSTRFVTYITEVAAELKKFGHIVSLNRLSLFGMDKRLLAVYQNHEEQETAGSYVVSQTGNDTYLPLGDSSMMVFGDKTISDMPLPAGVASHYEEDIPDTISIGLFSEDQKLGIRITAPVYYNEKKTGVLIGEMYYTQNLVTRYASLSKTAINLFVGKQLSVGTLPGQTNLASETTEQMVLCEDILIGEGDISISSVKLGEQNYYQGQCAFGKGQETIGVLSVSLSQNIEKQEIRKILKAILLISGSGVGVAFVLSLVLSRKTIHSIHNIVSIIGLAAEGDLRRTAMAITRDEIGMLAAKLNQMITQLRTISGQVQNASYAVNSTAETILREMETLIQHMEQQSTSVDNTTGSIEKIKQFIDVVARNTSDLLSAAAQILSSIQETRASIEEVTTSTGFLTTNLHLISSSVDQVNRAVKQISENTGYLTEVAQQTETEIQNIEQSLGNVSHNADQTQQFAKETMEAAKSGQASVEASIQGMNELKEVASNTAQIIQEVNSWGEQVSSILDIVDEITEQTSLLALNASIISAQAGTHGRGFAVVADEIKELATRTKASTKEIGTLVHELQKKTEEGVTNTTEGMEKADQGMQLANAVKESLNTILERATRSSNRAADTAQVIQQTVTSSQAISTQMNRVTEMVSKIRATIQDQEKDVEQVVAAVENISEMAEQVNRASVEQKRAAGEIERSMEEVTVQFDDISEQTEVLRQNSDQIVTAMHTIESTANQIFQNATAISGETVKNLVQQSDVLQKIVNVFKLS